MELILILGGLSFVVGTVLAVVEFVIIRIIETIPRYYTYRDAGFSFGLFIIKASEGFFAFPLLGIGLFLMEILPMEIEIPADRIHPLYFCAMLLIMMAANVLISVKYPETRGGYVACVITKAISFFLVMLLLSSLDDYGRHPEVYMYVGCTETVSYLIKTPWA